MNFKKILQLFLVLFVLGMIAGCGGDKGSSDTQTNTAIDNSAGEDSSTEGSGDAEEEATSEIEEDLVSEDDDVDIGELI